MKSKLYVGNLPFEIENVDLENFFSEIGTVQSINLIKDTHTGKNKGFGFVEMNNQQEATKAIEDLNGKELKGRTLRVNLANDDNRGKGRSSRSRY